MPGGKFGQANEAGEQLELTEKEREYEAKIAAIWKGILNIDVDGSTDFFASGAGSMDVVRLVEEVRSAKNCMLKQTNRQVKDKCDDVELLPEDVYMGPFLEDFVKTTILKLRSGGGNGPIEMKYDAVSVERRT